MGWPIWPRDWWRRKLAPQWKARVGKSLDEWGWMSSHWGWWRRVPGWRIRIGKNLDGSDWTNWQWDWWDEIFFGQFNCKWIYYTWHMESETERCCKSQKLPKNAWETKCSGQICLLLWSKWHVRSSARRRNRNPGWARQFFLLLKQFVLFEIHFLISPDDFETCWFYQCWPGPKRSIVLFAKQFTQIAGPKNIQYTDM